MNIHKNLIQFLQEANHILIFTGAGISTSSGIPDFRGPQGIWKRYQPIYYHDFMQSKKSRIEHWQYKYETSKAFRKAKPNAAHYAISQLEKAGKIELVITQNIDGLHKKAGTSKLVELHGTNDKVECQECSTLSDPDPHFKYFEETKKPPICSCGGYLKIATISFGQSLREEDLEKALQGARKADLVIALGSSLTVYPAASLTLLAAEKGSPYIIINQGPTEHDHHHYLNLRLEGNVSKIFPVAVQTALST